MTDYADDIAIIGIACRFPGANGPDEFWRNLRDGVESIHFFSDEELIAEGIEKQLIDDPRYVKARGILENIDLFDAAFFDYSPREAELMDPQHRLLLECAWEALENAGYDARTYRNRIGVFAGQSQSSYLLSNLYPNEELLQSVGAHQAMLGNDRDYLTTRISYKLDLRGPSINVQTACSTSLVAVHLACQSLLNGECSMALAGGVSIVIPHRAGYLYQEGGILSPDGHCRAFDSQAAGCLEGSGVGIIVLTTLENALASGDTIHAIIKGSAINNDGSLKAGYTAPGVDGQAEVIHEALMMAGVEPESIGYVEAHGTGTNIGDPIEIAALTQAFRSAANRNASCAIGSVKTNIGHLDATAGIAGLIKTVLALRNRAVPPSLHFNEPNPAIDFANSPFYVNASLSEWRAGQTPRRAGISSFGIGGTNAHVILEEAPDRKPATEGRPWQLLTLSARTQSALEAMTEGLASHLKENRDLNFSDVTYTLQAGRRAFEHRKVIVCSDINDAIEALEGGHPQRTLVRSERPKTCSPVFMFPGQGAQYVHMALDLYKGEPQFRHHLDTCAEFLKPYLKSDIRDILFPADNRSGDAEAALRQTLFTQTSLFVIEYATAKLLMDYGVQPRAMIGHSLGEYVAACLAGVFSLEDALKLIAARGHLMQSMPAGTMLAVALSESELIPLLSEKVSVAALNSPSQLVVSGPTDAVEELERRLIQRGINHRRLSTSHALHSEMMEPILNPFRQQLREIKLSRPRIPYISNVTGTWVRDSEATDPDYWAAHIRQPVRFEAGLRELLKDPTSVFIEVGPGQVLGSLAKRHPAKASSHVITHSIPRREDRQPALMCLLKALGQVWLAGGRIDWKALHSGESRFRIPLPSYPFERRRYWIDPPSQKTSHLRQTLKGNRKDIADWFYVPLWKQSVPPAVFDSNRLASEAGCWLVFADETGLGQSLINLLRDHQQNVVTVKARDRFAKTGDWDYTVDPSQPEDYERLLNEFEASGITPQKVIHLWSVTSCDLADSYISGFDHQDLSFHSLVYLARALKNYDVSAKLAVISDNLHRIAGRPVTIPEKALLIGPCKVIPQECPSITCQSIDVSLDSIEASDDLSLQLIAEITADSADSIIAYRSGSRWAQSLEPVRLDKHFPAVLRHNGVYLITGGLGGLGFELAGFLARAFQARLILTGRSPIPEKARWNEWLLGHGDDDEVSIRIRKAKSLEDAGANVQVYSADVANLEQMRRVVEDARSRLGRIDGVIHTAGVAGGELIQTGTRAASDSVLSSKVTGTRVIESLFKDSKLDFLLLFSSLNSITGGAGQTDYAAANAFLDAFAHYYSRSSGTRTISINWDAWRDAGMAAQAASQGGLRHQKDSRKSIDHPLLDRLVNRTANQTTFLTEFSPSRHWVLNEHRIVGNPVIPGTAYLEMAVAALENKPDRMVEITDSYFVTPLRVPDGESKDVYTVLMQDGDGFTFSMKSKTPGASGVESGWQEHAMGSIKYASPTSPRKHSITEIIERCSDREILCSNEGLDEKDGPRWRILKSVHVGKKEVLAALELPDTFSADLDQFKLHPSLLDVATGAPKMFIGDGAAYLPLSYKRLAVKGSLPRKVYSYARYREDPNSKKETVSFDLSIMNEDGIEIVEIEDFTAKRVNDSASKIKAWEAEEYQSVTDEEAGSAAQPQDDKYSIDLSNAISTEEGIDALCRILNGSPLPQIAVSTKDLRYTIDQVNLLSASLFAKGDEDTPLFGATHSRPDIQTPYVAPRNDLEKQIAEAWQSILGIDKVGIHDNFFELGGDSVMAIQIIAQVNRKAINITPQQLFQNQTVAELAAVASSNDSAATGTGLSDGAMPLTPTQLRILSYIEGDENIELSPLVFEAKRGLKASLLAETLSHLVAHHDALKIRLRQDSSGWQQYHAKSEVNPCLFVDLSSIPEQEQKKAMKLAVDQLLSDMKLLGGALFHVLLFKFNSSESDRIVFVLHPLIADDASWPVLLEDFEAIYEQLDHGWAVHQQPKTASFNRWIEWVTTPPPAESLNRYCSYWSGDMKTKSSLLPVDMLESRERGRSARTVFTNLDTEETRALLCDIADTYHTKTEDILLTALSESISACSGTISLLVEVWRDAREVAVTDLDLSRTIGQISYGFPVLLKAGKSQGLGDAIKSVKEQLRSVPDDGAGYTLLMNSPGRDQLPQAQISFTYLEHPCDCISDSMLMRRESLFDTSSPLAKHNLLDIRAFIKDDRLQLAWTYDETAYLHSTIEKIIRIYKERLSALIAHCRFTETEDYTPSDFPLAGLDEEKLNKLSALISKSDI